MFLCGAFSALPLINARARAALDNKVNNESQAAGMAFTEESE
tara:strand:- start:1946 stop:2071 length:126 start_codon:yes stop_codon:yes gene_type:complete